jgi:hypothetical protein
MTLYETALQQSTCSKSWLLAYMLAIIRGEAIRLLFRKQISVRGCVSRDSRMLLHRLLFVIIFDCSLNLKLSYPASAGHNLLSTCLTGKGSEAVCNEKSESNYNT